MRKKMGALKAYSYLRIWLGNGQGFLNDFKYPIFLATALKVFFPTATYLFLGLIAVAICLILIFIGWFDLKFIKIYQRTADISTSEYNPYFKRLERKV